MLSLCTILSRKKTEMPCILVINHSLTLFPKLGLFFDLNVIDARGKILYNRIFVKKWSELLDETSFIRKQFNLHAILLEDKI
jgi:hypothetical protein